MGIKERKQREREKRKQAIIFTAKYCFKEHGYKNTSIVDIADQCDLSAGTIYLYFENKEDLYASVLTSVFEYLFMRFKHIENQDIPDREDRLNALTDAMIDAYSKEPKYTLDLFRMLSQKENSISAKNKDDFVNLFNQTKKITEKIFRGKDKTIISKNGDSKILSDIFWSTFIGVVTVETGKMNLFHSEIRIRPKLEATFGILKRGLLH